MKKKCILAGLSTIFVSFVFTGICTAGLINGGFESGLTGWTVATNGGAVADVVSHGGWSPQEGTRFALLTAGNPNTPVQLSQSITASTGDVLTGKYFWDGGDYMGFNDWGTGRILTAAGAEVTTLFHESIEEHGDYADYPAAPGWASFSYAFATSGTFTLLFEVANYGDGFLASYVGVDDVQLNAVPLPGAVLLGFLGLSAGGLGLRRRA